MNVICEKIIKSMGKLLLAFTLLASSSIHAQVDFQNNCVEGGAFNGSYCSVRPDEVTPWVYDGGASMNEADSIQKRMNAVVYSSPYYGQMCNIQIVMKDEVPQYSRFLEGDILFQEWKYYDINYGWRDDEGRCTSYGLKANGGIFKNRDLICKHGWPYWLGDPGGYTCLHPLAKAPPSPPSCPKTDYDLNVQNIQAGNPISVLAREKIQNYSDVIPQNALDLEFVRTYRSSRAQGNSFLQTHNYANPPNQPLGVGWTHNHNIHLAFTSIASNSSNVNFSIARVQLEDGEFSYLFSRDGKVYKSRDFGYKLVLLENQGNGAKWEIDNASRGVKYTFNDEGNVLRKTYRNGNYISYEYADNLLTLVVASRTIIWSLVKQMRVCLIPLFHGLHRRTALER